jgi:hypothetical protein
MLPIALPLDSKQSSAGKVLEEWNKKSINNYILF